MLKEMFSDSAVRSSITRELALDLERARTGSRGAERAMAGWRVGDDVARRVRHYLPQERAEFTWIAEEQAMSRLYGGIHFRFDNEVGLALGRVVGRHAVARERSGGLSAWQAVGKELKR